MIFKPYPKYTSCAIQWFNEIPQSWKQVRVEQYLIKKDENIGDLWSSTQLLSLTQKGIIEKDINEGKGKTHSDYSTYQAIDIGDLVFCLFDIDETPRTVGLSTKKGMITSAYTAFKSKENINTQYVYYFFESLDDAKALKPYYKGLRKTVRPPEFLKIHVPFPPKVEQVAISQFLDTETARIDNLIGKQEKLIELLEEQRKSIISHAVTKGLNPNVPMKDSGVEWLGQVPEHWSYSSLKYVLKQKKGAIKSGPFGSHLKSSDMVYSDVKVINQRNVIDKDFIGGDNFISFEKYEELKSFTIYPKDVLVTTRGTIGKVAQVAEDLPISILHPCLIRIQVDENKVLFDYINYFFECEKLSLEQLRYASNAATIDVIYCENLASIYLPIPSISEQNEIIKYLKDEDIKINKLISKQKTLIEKLKEYRSSIISHAVTGKIDVREFGA